jgi:hypothetical protein
MTTLKKRVAVKKKATDTFAGKAIYVLVPATVTVLHGRQHTPVVIPMAAGRLMAQNSHVTSLMRGTEYLKHKDGTNLLIAPITTIVLSVRNSRELDFMQKVLRRHGREAKKPYSVYEFFDENLLLYGTKAGVKSVICTTPVDRAVIAEVVGHLPSFGE